MSNMNDDESSPGFKLFGKTIVTAGRDLEEDVAAPETTTGEEAEDDEEITEKTRMKRVHLPCPRCKSKDTKFCYFNNYNVNQPRHFCKACHRYWTAGGAIRNVPVGAGRRKNRTLPATSASRDGGDGGGGICLVGGREEVGRWLRSS